jgi:hypothetical protein
MTELLIREDTGTHAVVRVIDPGVHVSAPYSRACGLLDKWAKAERHAVDEFAAWIEGQAAQAKAEMRLLCDELGAPFAWAELPVVVEPRRGWIPRRPSDVMAELYEQRFNPVQQYMDADSGDDMPGVPVLVPAIEGTYLMPRPVEQAGPQGPIGQWLDEQLKRPGRWWRRKQAARDARMGVGS